MEKYRFMMIGAHPDDMELRCGGLALRLRRQGHEVMFLSMTDGGAGHHEMEREALVQRRKQEAEAVARLFDIRYRILPIADGELEATLENSRTLVREIRAYAPHVILTHRVNDYHPDHRACAQLVMDCSFMVNVPMFCPDSPCPAHTPAILSVSDGFTRPAPFHPDVVVPIDDVVEKKIDGTLRHVSQLYEWLPFVNRWEEILAAETFEEKTVRLRERLRIRFSTDVRRFPELMPDGVEYAETFEWNEYGAPLSDELRRVMTEATGKG